MSQAVSMQSPLATCFILHIAVEAPFVIQAFWNAQSLPFLDMNNTTILMMKLYAALSFGTCVAALLSYPLPDFLPGKRALAIACIIYHCAVSTIMIQAPRFIPITLGAFAESYKITPEILWGTAHGFLSLFFITWWQGTVGLTQAAGAGMMRSAGQ